MFSSKALINRPTLFSYVLLYKLIVDLLVYLAPVTTIVLMILPPLRYLYKACFRNCKGSSNITIYSRL